jgi:hypothetical protein
VPGNSPKTGKTVLKPRFFISIIHFIFNPSRLIAAISEAIPFNFTVQGSVVATAAISVYDESDPLVVVPNPDRAEEVSSGSPVINYAPVVCKQGDTAMAPIAGYTFSYLLTNSAYQQIASGTGTSFAVTFAHGVAAGENMTLIITASN